MPGDFADALISFIIYLVSNPVGGTMIVAAGLVPLLIQLLENRIPSRLHVSGAIQSYSNMMLTNSCVDRLFRERSPWSITYYMALAMLSNFSATLGAWTYL
jgi:hypothetical protein